MPNYKDVTLQTLAERLGLSAHTVSKALRGLPGMSERTRAEVIELATRLGYRSKEQERALRVERISIYSTKSRRFAYIMPRRSLGTIHRQLLDGIQTQLTQFGHTLETLTEPTLQEAAAFRPKHEEGWAWRSGLHYMDGVFIPPLIAPVVEEQLISLPVPAILLNYPPPAAAVDSVVWDVATAVHQSVRCLLAHGHRRILYIGDNKHHRGFRIRWHAFCEAMHAAGVAALSASYAPQDSSTGEAYVHKLADAIMREAPTALVVGLEHDLDPVYYACRLLGRTIPKDYALIGLEHSPNRLFRDITHPELLVKETGARGVDRMLWRISNPTLPYEHIQVQGRWHEGYTVRPISGDQNAIPSLLRGISANST
ncbi:LacI family DNA-binding transcriptional regulator [Paenibacillus sp. JCM 10914]|uniref:LacI family DNA-binding transcriptional regulator n=1 Tax=Paenibacillus sp. JCM 10914 TaxID=1236974 RepID=UPI0003CC46F7|nr:LacI family DNA-binding transcriptional regulator [Paenibacillus sp. JCM 10914]GAE08698.1 transcriptional regulator [Paenibacillus sp. JCM 10914]